MSDLINEGLGNYYLSINRQFLSIRSIVRHPMVFISLNLFDLFECPVMLMTLILVIRF